MQQSIPFLFLLWLLSACTSNPAGELQALETAYYAQPDSASGQRLLSAYEAHLATLADAPEERATYMGKMATLNVRMGIPEGTQAAMTGLLALPPTSPAAKMAAMQVLDTILYAVVDAKTQRMAPDVGKQYVALVTQYAKARPDDVDSPALLYKAAEIARSIGEYRQALDMYSHIEQFFPKYEKASKACFMQAFTWAEDLQDIEQARLHYQAFIDKYPNDDFVDDAQILLDNLGKSDEEIFNSLQ